MKTRCIGLKYLQGHLKFWLACLAGFLLAGSAARAGLSFELHLIRFSQGTAYRFFTPLETNTVAPDAAFGTYLISSPFATGPDTTNGSWRALQVSDQGVNTLGGRENAYQDFNSFMNQITNGTWTIEFTNSTTTNFYTFAVSAPTMTSNMLPAAVITYPINGAVNVSNQTTLTWQPLPGFPSATTNSYVANYDFSMYQPFIAPAGQTNFTLPTPIPDGTECTFNLDFVTNNTTSVFVIGTPQNTNVSHAAISGWVPTSALDAGDSVSFAITNAPTTTATLIAHYTFDSTGNVGADSSGNGFDLNFNGGNGVTKTNDARVGAGAADFDGSSFLSYSSAPPAVLHALAGDFSISFWIKTVQDSGNEGGPGWNGVGIVAADIPRQLYDIIPAALDGGQIGFNTGPNDDTINTTTNINNINPSQNGFHHVVVTRNQVTGEKRIYIDGALNVSDIATVNPLSDPHLVAIGAAIDASQTDPNNANPAGEFQGELDDLQIYSGVLSPTDVSRLYATPAQSVGLVAHYTFDDNNDVGHDDSGNGNDLDFNGGNGVFTTSDAKTGGAAAQFDGGSFLSYNSMPQSVLNAFAGNFTLSFWIKTAQHNGNGGGQAFAGAGIVAADVPGGANDLVPAALDGDEIGFNTGPDDDTLNATTDITAGNTFHHVVVTRELPTGEKKIYTDGVLDNSDVDDTNLLNDPVLVAIGCAIDASEADPNNANPSQYFQGVLDDLQIYSVVLTSNQVTFLNNNPGSTVTLPSGVDFNPALNTTNLTWTTGGDADWFVETTITHDGVSAARSGAITDGQATHLDTTAPSNGQVSFYWKVSSEDTFDFLHFYINGVEQDSISDEVDWTLKSFPVSAGDLLRWEYTKDPDCCSGGLDAGFLGQVSFGTVPVTITTNPFDQTNYPGYNVALLAGAAGAPTPTLQWYKVGTGLITGATNTLYIPTNSGNASVAGGYYAIATNSIGSAITRTAAVTFVSAPLPLDWATAFKSPFEPVDETDTNNYDYYYGCVVDANSNIYTAAEFSGRMNVSTQKLVSGFGGDAAAVVKQAPDGSGLWAAAFTNNGAGSSYALCVAGAPNSGVYVSGNYNGDNWLGTNHLTDAGHGGMFLARFDANGSNVWLKTFGGANPDFMIINSLASDGSGNVTLCGLLGAGLVTIGNSNYNVIGQEGLIVQLDQTGNVLWSQLLPSEFPEYIITGGGRIYFCINPVVNDGVTTNIVVGGVTNSTDRAWAVACVNSTDGHLLWVRGVGARNGSGNGNPYAAGIQDDVPRLAISGTNLFMTGVAYDSTAVFGSFTVNFSQPRGQYFARYDTNGTPQVVTTYGSVTTTPVVAVANTNGEVYVSGDFDTYSFFGVDMIAGPFYTKQNPGAFSQAFVAKFDANGNPLWARRVVSPDVVNFRGIALAADGVWASGWGITSNLTAFSPIFFGTNSVKSEVRELVPGAGGSTFNLFYPAGVLGKIVDVVTAPQSPLLVTLVSQRNNGTNFQFSFQSQSGFTHSVQYRTNLVFGTDWQIYTNAAGDNTLQIIPIPYSVFGGSRQGFIRLMTH